MCCARRWKNWMTRRSCWTSTSSGCSRASAMWPRMSTIISILTIHLLYSSLSELQLLDDYDSLYLTCLAEGKFQYNSLKIGFNSIPCSDTWSEEMPLCLSKALTITSVDWPMWPMKIYVGVSRVTLCLPYKHHRAHNLRCPYLMGSVCSSHTLSFPSLHMYAYVTYYKTNSSLDFCLCICEHWYSCLVCTCSMYTEVGYWHGRFGPGGTTMLQMEPC